MKSLKTGITASLFFLLFSCGNNEKEIDLSEIHTREPELLRFERDLFKLTESNFEEQSQFLQNKYGSFYEHYLMNFICPHGTKDSAYKRKILFFVNDTVVGLAYKYTQAIY